MSGGWKHLKDDVSRMGADNVFTCLVWPLAEGADPDDAFSSVPYEKVTSSLGWHVFFISLYKSTYCMYIGTMKTRVNYCVGYDRKHFI